MGLYAIAIRDSTAASRIPAILKERGYDVQLKSENDSASVFAYPIKRGEMVFSISKGKPQRFSTGIGREGQELVRILGEHGVFEALDESGRASAG